MPPIRTAVKTGFRIEDKVKEEAGIRKVTVEVHPTVGQTVLIIIQQKLQGDVRSDSKPAVRRLEIDAWRRVQLHIEAGKSIPRRCGYTKQIRLQGTRIQHKGDRKGKSQTGQYFVAGIEPLARLKHTAFRILECQRFISHADVQRPFRRFRILQVTLQAPFPVFPFADH